MNQLGCVSLAKDWIQYSSTFVTLSRFFGWKEIRIVCNKIAQKAIAYVVATWQRLDNVGQRRCHNVGDRRRHNSHFRPCDNVVTMSTTTLWQRCHNVVVPAGLCVERILTLQMTIYLVDYKMCCQEKKPGKKIPKPNPNPFRGFFPGDFFCHFLIQESLIREKKLYF